MVNTILLRQIIKNSGLKYQYIAENLGITRYALANKLENKSEFKACEILKLTKLLHIESLEQKENIFFTEKVD